MPRLFTIRRLLAAVHALGLDQRGSLGMIAAAAMPALAVGTGVALDYSRFQNVRSLAQNAADSAALAVVHEAALAGTTEHRLIDRAKAFAGAALGDHMAKASVAARASSADGAVTVEVRLPVDGAFGRLTGLTQADIAVSATARLMGASRICLLALEPTKNKTLEISKAARIRAPDCSVFVNSADPKGLSIKDTGKLTARSICTSGGYEGSSANFEPLPRIDCPRVPDPLASRPPPPRGACDHTDKIVETGTVVLRPGVYCGGLRITKDAVAKLDPGIYVMRGAKLIVDGSATIEGTNVGIYLEGSNAQFEFDTNTTVSLAAPKDGPMAGLLFWEDRNASPGSKHRILSNNAHTLLGTVYLPRGLLFVDANRPIAERAAYTIIVASQIEMISGPELFLNANYGATDVPVPQGVGPVSGRAQLVR